MNPAITHAVPRYLNRPGLFIGPSQDGRKVDKFISYSQTLKTMSTKIAAMIRPEQEDIRSLSNESKSMHNEKALVSVIPAESDQSGRSFGIESQRKIAFLCLLFVVDAVQDEGAQPRSGGNRREAAGGNRQERGR